METKEHESDKRKSHIRNKLHTIYIFSNTVRHLLLRTSLNFTKLHFIPHPYTCRHFTSSHLNFAQLHFTTLSFGLNKFKFSTPLFQLISLHFTVKISSNPSTYSKCVFCS